MNNLGIIKEGQEVYSYQIGDFEPIRVQAAKAEKGIISTAPLSINGYRVFPFGENNLEPNIVKDMISDNRLLPELIEKQIKILYGNGPILYRSIVKEGKVIREYLNDIEIEEWLDSWLEVGLTDDFKIYINKCIRSYYYSEGIFSKWRLTNGFGSKYSKPIAGLEHISELRCRLATKKDLGNKRDFEEKDFPSVMVGNWSRGSLSDFSIYPKVNFAETLKNSAISYSKNPSQGEEIYAFNVFFRGIKSWIHGSNLTPEYINDYLENAMSARLHIIIPNSWVDSKEEMLKDICETNATLKAEGKDLQVLQFGSMDSMEVGTVYNKNLLNKYISKELKQFSTFLSGRGKNQGKFYATYSYMGEHGIEQWKIEEIPQKYKEYIEAITAYDKRADEVMLSSKGIDPSISNVSKEGIISKSGSDAYYNYMIYLNGLTIPESVVCKDINYAIKHNFPEKYKTGIRVGFYRPAIAKQQDVLPQNRMANQEDGSI